MSFLRLVAAMSLGLTVFAQDANLWSSWKSATDTTGVANLEYRYQFVSVVGLGTELFYVERKRQSNHI